MFHTKRHRTNGQQNKHRMDVVIGLSAICAYFLWSQLGNFPTMTHFHGRKRVLLFVFIFIRKRTHTQIVTHVSRLRNYLVRNVFSPLFGNIPLWASEYCNQVFFFFTLFVVAQWSRNVIMEEEHCHKLGAKYFEIIARHGFIDFHI